MKLHKLINQASYWSTLCAFSTICMTECFSTTYTTGRSHEVVEAGIAGFKTYVIKQCAQYHGA